MMAAPVGSCDIGSVRLEIVVVGAGEPQSAPPDRVRVALGGKNISAGQRNRNSMDREGEDAGNRGERAMQARKQVPCAGQETDFLDA